MNKRKCINFIIVLSILTFVFSLAGCQPFRSKFVRKKKKQNVTSNDFIPVLEPVDYIKQEKTAQERYSYRYSLWNVWQKDLLNAIDKEDSDKRLKYLLAEMIVQLKEMNKWIVGEDQEKLTGFINDLYEIREYLNKPPKVRNMTRVRKQIELNSKAIRNNLNKRLDLNYKQ
ncbi:MAG: hypothetical protein P9X22_05275 [Candidatus Zapsychrus exili]|nr:hypothetical protein [Candidatus Zapsychrus exili]